MSSTAKIMVFLALFALTGCMTTSVPGVGQRFRDCPECPEMVVVPSGSFLMGAPESEEGSEDDERPVACGGGSVVCGGRLRGDVCGVGRLRCGRRLRRPPA